MLTIYFVQFPWHTGCREMIRFITVHTDRDLNEFVTFKHKSSLDKQKFIPKMNKNIFRRWCQSDLDPCLSTQSRSRWVILCLTFLNISNVILSGVNQRYSIMLVKFGLPGVSDHAFGEETFFEKDDSTCFTTNVSLHFLRHAFPGHLISKYGDIQWPAHSTDLPALFFFRVALSRKCSKKTFQEPQKS